MKRIRTRAPLRLGLAGGGSDVPPYSDQYGGMVLNATIDQYAYCFIEASTNGHITLESSDLGKRESHKATNLLDISEGLILHRAVYNRFVKEFLDNKPQELHLRTSCDIPIGSGLGTSSTIVVAMVKAFAEFFSIPLDDYELSDLAYQIERVDCNLSGGRQDQYSATFGGFNFIEFRGGNDVLVTPLRLKESIILELEASIILFYGGESRNSAAIIDDQKQSIQSSESSEINAMHDLKTESLKMKESILKGELDSIAHSMRQGWIAKKTTSKSVSTPLIDNVMAIAEVNGALSGKVSGAGGGGYIMFICKPENRMNVVKALKNFGGEISSCHFTNKGVQAWLQN